MKLEEFILRRDDYIWEKFVFINNIFSQYFPRFIFLMPLLADNIRIAIISDPPRDGCLTVLQRSDWADSEEAPPLSAGTASETTR